MALAAGYTWIGRGYSFDIKHLKELMKEAILHRGAALLNVLQPCPTYNNLQDKEFYHPRVYKIEEDGYDGVVQDPSNDEEVRQKVAQAITKSMVWGDRIPIGRFYKIDLPTFEDRIHQRIPQYPERNPATERYWDDAGRPTTDIAPYMGTLRIG